MRLPIRCLTTCFALWAIGSPAFAASTIFLAPTTMTVAPGETFEIEIWMDFEANTLGGSFDVLYNEQGLVFAAWEAAPLGDPAFIRPPDDFSGWLSGFSFGDFNDPITGLNLIGTLTMSVLQDAPLGTYQMITSKGVGCINCGFLDADNFTIIPVEYGSADIVVRPIPLPAALWLLGAALAPLMLGQRMPAFTRR